MRPTECPLFVNSMKALLKILLTLQLLLLIPCSVYGLRLYSHAEYNAARERAVQAARNGDHKSALISLERLLKLEPDNYGAFNDYLTILVWDEQYHEALQKAQFLNFKETPEYVLRALINAAEKEQNIQVLRKLVKIYIDKYPIVPADAPAIIAGKNFQEIAELTASAGWNQTSLSILEVLHYKQPTNQDILASYIDALHRNNHPRQALALLPLVKIEDAPEFEMDALIKSSQELDEKAVHQKLLTKVSQPVNVPRVEAQSQQQQEIKIQISPSIRIKTKKHIENVVKVKRKSPPPSQPSRQDIIAAARQLLKAHDFEKAAKLLYPLYIQGNRSEELLNTVALYFTSQKEYARAAFIYQQLYELNPENRAAKRYMILNLFYAGAPFKALEWLKTDPSLLSLAETDKIRTDILAFKLRWAGYTLPENVKQADLVDEVITQLAEELQKREPQGYDYNLRRVQMDYIVALQERGLTRKVIERYALLYSENYIFPDYALRSVADAYLERQQPEEARGIYLDLLKRDPHNFSLQKALFWTYFDNGDFTKGLELATTLDAQTPLWRKDHTGNITKENSEKLSIAILAAMGKAYAQDLAGSQKDLEKMNRMAPYNSEILYNLTELYRWRGWPLKSLETGSIATTFDPDSIALEISKAYSLVEMYRFSEAEQLWAALMAEYPDHKEVQKFDKEWQRLHNRQFLLWSDGGKSDSDQSNYGSSDFSLESILYDKLYKTGLRPFIHQNYTTATFDEGKGRYQRLGLGTEFKRNRNLLSVELSGSYGEESDIGFSLHDEFAINDQFQLSFGYDSFSTDIPVRAYFYDISGPGYKAAAQYRLHERTKFAASYMFLDFSDNNRRNSWSLLAQQRLVSLPKVTIDLIPSIYHSSNSKIVAPYFNPEEDTSYSLSVATDWLTYCHYDNRFTQNLELTFGRYYQKNYGTDSIYELVYTHTWDIDNTLNFAYGFKWSSNYYDGDNEKRLAAFTSLGWIF